MAKRVLKKVTKETMQKMVNVEPIEEIASLIADQIAEETDDVRSRISREWEDQVKKLIAKYGAASVRAVFERRYVEYIDEPQIDSPFDLMKELF